MKKIYFFLVFFMSFFISVGQPVTKSEVMKVSQVVVSYLSDFKGYKVAEIKPIFDGNGQLLAYVSLLKPNGFVVVSPDKRIYPVISFSNEGNFDFRFTDENILLSMLQTDMGCLVKGINSQTGSKAKSFFEKNRREWDSFLNESKNAIKDTVQYGPWIPSVWGGVNCKDENGNYIYVGNYFTPNHYSPGCVATSLSQILFRYKWPVHGIGSHTDYDNSGSSQGSYYAGFYDMYYDWPNMLDKYMNLPSTDAERRACGRLQYHCGVAVDMDYENEGSTSNINRTPNALSSYFRYIGHYETTSWSSFWTRLNSNLEDGMPVQLAVEADNGAGHAIACDGYRQIDGGDKYYHLNMGWWGTCNAWYRISISFNSCGYTSVTAGVFDILPEPEIVASSENRTCDEKTFYIRWRVSKEKQWDAFSLEQSDDGGSTWTVLDDNIQDTFYLVTVPQFGKTYKYRVRTKYNGYWYYDSYSNVLSVYVKDDLTYLNFDGDDSFYFNDNDNNDLDVTDNWTFEFWFNADAIPSATSYPVIFDRRYSYTMYYLADDVGSGDYAVKFVARNSSDAIIASVSSNTNADLMFGQWYHVAVTNDGSTTRMFINGQLVASSTDPDFNFAPSIKTFNVGARYWDSGYERYMDAKLDQFRISKVARYTSNFTPDRYDRPAVDDNTVVQFNLDEGYGSNIHDETGNFGTITMRAYPNDPNWMYSPYRTEWNGSVSSDWADASNWSDGVPDSTRVARILGSATNMPIINSDIIVRNIFVEDGATLTVSPGASLRVKASVCNSGNIILESPATDLTPCGVLVDTGTLGGSGTYSAQRFMKGNRWNFFSIPVQNVTTEQFTASGNPFNKHILWYDETDASADWMNGWKYAFIDQSTPGNLNVMQGYAYANSDDFMADFKGTFNTGTFKFSTTYTPSDDIWEHEGWNFVGNPYPSPLNWDKADGWIKNNIDNTIYFWNGVNYSYYVGSGGNVNGTGVNNATNIIPPMTGFMVKATANGSLTVNCKARTTANHDYYKAEKDQNQLIRLKLTADKFSDETAIRLLSFGNDGYDKNLDAIKFFSDNDDVPQIYTMSDGNTQFAINTITDNFEYKSFNVMVKLPSPGEYTVSAILQNLPSTYTVKFTDLETQQSINLAQKQVYTFKTSSTELTDRFVLEIYKSATNENMELSNLCKVYSFDNQIVIIVPAKFLDKATAQIYDISGRKIAEQKISHIPEKLNISQKGIYLVKLVTPKGTVTRKVEN